jgi:hypothetical protein
VTLLVGAAGSVFSCARAAPAMENAKTIRNKTGVRRRELIMVEQLF